MIDMPRAATITPSADPPFGRGLALWCLAVLIAILPFDMRGASAQPQSRICTSVKFEDENYITCRVDLRLHRLGLYWRAPGGDAFGSLGALTKHLQSGGERPLFAMNAGMYHADLDPVGLYVEKGREIVRASTTNGPGNFHMKPNGVFYVSSGKAGVVETGQYLKRGVRAEIATQSGPMLVINNRLHPRFSAEGISRKVRNGVGVRDGDIVIFAISEGPVTFTAFARLFKEQLGTPNALYLDGSVSSLTAPGLDRTGFRSLGPMIAAFEKDLRSTADSIKR